MFTVYAAERNNYSSTRQPFPLALQENRRAAQNVHVLTRSARPYGLIENVVTHLGYRKQGIGTQVLQYALNIAWEQNCYKVMLLAGSKNEATLHYSEQAGFARGEKTGFVARPPHTEP